MFDEEKVLENLNSYLKKLMFIIENNASFTFFGFKLVKKNRIDDLFCCIEATLPQEYKDAVRKFDQQEFKGYSCYLEFIESFKKNKSLSADYYLINYNVIYRQLPILKSSIKFDLKKITQDNKNKF